MQRSIRFLATFPYCEGRNKQDYSVGNRSGPATSLYVGTHAEFHVSNVAPHTVDS